MDIYQHIWRDKRAGGTLWHHLRQRGRRGRRDRKYGRRGLIAGRIGIENRPAHIEARTRIGDWEVDTVFGAGHEGVLVSLTERKTRLEVLARVADKSAPAVRFGIVSALSALPRRTHTITSDNGKEFAAHRHIARALNAQFFFAHPYAAWERGTNENANGLLRQYFPRTRNFATITDQELARFSRIHRGNRHLPTFNYVRDTARD